MVSEFEFFHGAVIAKMLHAAHGAVSVAPYSPSDNASYVVDGRKGLYIKYSTKRLSPWSFSFQGRHRDTILQMKSELGEVFVILVCNEDGAVVLSFQEFRQVVDEHSEAAQWISAARNRRQMYSVKGSDGKLAFKIAMDDLTKVFAESPNRPSRPEDDAEEDLPPREEPSAPGG